MKNLLIFFLCCHLASPVKHSLKYFCTAAPGAQSIPEFVCVGHVDGVSIGDCNPLKGMEVHKDWIDFFKDHPPLVDWYVSQCLDGHHFFKATIESLRQRLNQTEVLPSVSLLQKSPSSPISCHATGFYPHRAVMFWRKDGEEIHEDVDHGEILPNNDGTFQMSVDLKLSSVTPADWERYDCVFQLSDVSSDIITKLDKAVIRTNMAETPTDMVISISAAVVVLALILIAAAAFVAHKKKKAECSPSCADNDSEQSERLNTQS